MRKMTSLWEVFMLIIGIAALAAVIAAVSAICGGAFASAAWIWVLPLKFVGLFWRW